MKRLLIFLLLLTVLLSGCNSANNQVQVVATTAPVYAFTNAVCAGTDIKIAQLVTENVSCLHDYTLQAGQMHLLESADLVILSGLGLEDFLEDPLKTAKNTIDASAGITPLYGDDHAHTEHAHSHEKDPHIWLSPDNAAIMSNNIFTALSNYYPEQKDKLYTNYLILADKISALKQYAADTLSNLKCRDLITFHDGFSYLARAFDLHILRAIEEESGREASAAELIDICAIITDNKIPSIFTEKNSSDSAAKIIAKETGTNIYTLDMIMSGTDYFEAMYHNINTLKEALG